MVMILLKWYNIIRYKLLGRYKEEWEKQTIIHDLYFFSFGCLWTSSLNDKHSCQLFRMGLRDKTTLTLTTPLRRANMRLCGSYHLLQSCFSFFVHLNGQPEPFDRCIILQSCSSFFFCLHGQPELFASDHLLQFYVPLQLIFITSLQSFESGQAQFLVIFSFLINVSYPRPFVPLSSVTEALLALSFPFLSERFFFVRAKAALVHSWNE